MLNGAYELLLDVTAAASVLSFLPHTPQRPLSLAIPPWVGAMSNGDGFGQLWEEAAPLKLRFYGAL